MDHASSGVHGDVIRQHANNFAIEKRMLEIQVARFSGRGSVPAACGSARLHFDATSLASFAATM